MAFSQEAGEPPRHFSLLDYARKVILSEPVSGPLVNSLQTTNYLMGKTVVRSCEPALIQWAVLF